MKRFFWAFGVLLIGAIAFFWGLLEYTYRYSFKNHHASTVLIPKGSSLENIASRLKEAGVIDQPFFLIWNARLRGLYPSLKAGEYVFPGGCTVEEILNLLISGKTVLRKFTAIEGHTTRQIIQVLNQTKGLEGVISEALPEGCFYPETYYFSYGDQRQTLVERMRQAQQKHLEHLWNGRDSGLLLKDKKELVIVASIIEKETALPEERSHVAGVFYNRLRVHMRLQSDPTVLYGLHVTQDVPLNTVLRRDDLAKPSPFNTYLNQGLPPTPICNPGWSSLYATVHPVKTKDLYFVADGEGGHIFSPSYEIHKRHHQTYRRLRASQRQRGLDPHEKNVKEK